MEIGDLVQVAEDLACQHQGGAHTGRHRTRLPGSRDNRSFSVIVALPDHVSRLPGSGDLKK